MKTSQRGHYLWLADKSGPPFVVGFQSFVAVSRSSLEIGCLLSTLENTFLVLGLCFGLSRSQFPAAPFTDPESSWGFTGILETSGPKEEDCPLFRLVEIEHTDLGFVTASHLPSSFLEFSSTWRVPFQLNENGCERTLKDS